MQGLAALVVLDVSLKLLLAQLELATAQFTTQGEIAKTKFAVEGEGATRDIEVTKTQLTGDVVALALNIKATKAEFPLDAQLVLGLGSTLGQFGAGEFCLLGEGLLLEVVSLNCLGGLLVELLLLESRTARKEAAGHGGVGDSEHGRVNLAYCIHVGEQGKVVVRGVGEEAAKEREKGIAVAGEGTVVHDH